MTGLLAADAPHREAADRLLAVARVPAEALRVARLLRAAPLPATLAREVGRTASDALERVLPASSRPALVLEGTSGVLRLNPSDVALEPGLSSLDLVRGRDGARIVATSGARVLRNGWPVAVGLATPLADGDIVEADGASWRARYEPPRPGPLLEAVAARRSSAPPAGSISCAFSLVPSNERLVVAVDLATARALGDVLLGGTGDAPFEATAVGRVERELVEWAVRRAVHDAGRSLDAGVAFTPAEPALSGEEIWCEAAVRVGRYQGAAWIGATEGAITHFSSRFMAQTRAERFRRPAVARIEATLAASVPIGRVTPGELATLEPGDLLVAVEGRASFSDGLFGDGVLTVLGAEPAAVRARFVSRGSVLSATVGDFGSLEGGGAVSDAETKTTVEQAPFERVLDELTVAVSVEVARKRMPLGELLAISRGDVVELNAPISAGVRIVVDGVTLGRGELVDVEGALGVRVTSIGGAR
jgi:type III secretion system YscQ/HrcQ family protein